MTSSPNDHAWEAAAKQLPPPRSLVLLLEGFNTAAADGGGSDACCSLDDVALPHFDAVARQGVSFCAAVREGEHVPCVHLLSSVCCQ